MCVVEQKDMSSSSSSGVSASAKGSDSVLSKSLSESNTRSSLVGRPSTISTSPPLTAAGVGVSTSGDNTNNRAVSTQKGA